MKSYLRWTDDFPTGDRVIEMRLVKSEMQAAVLDKFDHMLLDDIRYGEPSDTPIADQLLGLEMLVRRIEQATQPSNKSKE